MFNKFIWFRRWTKIGWIFLPFNENCYECNVVQRVFSQGFLSVGQTFRIQTVRSDIFEWLDKNCNKKDYKFVFNEIRFIKEKENEYSNILGIKFLKNEDATLFKIVFF